MQLLSNSQFQKGWFWLSSKLQNEMRKIDYAKEFNKHVCLWNIVELSSMHHLDAFMKFIDIILQTIFYPSIYLSFALLNCHADDFRLTHVNIFSRSKRFARLKYKRRDGFDQFSTEFGNKSLSDNHYYDKMQTHSIDSKMDCDESHICFR